MDTTKITALITGINGQIGDYLVKYLTTKNYNIIGLIRDINKKKYHDITYIECDITNKDKLQQIITDIQPNEIYNLAAITDAPLSIDNPETTLLTNGNIVLTICETIRKINKPIKLFQANSSELFKGLNTRVINEDLLEFYPKNPYGIGKLMAYWIIRYYREYYGLYVCNGIIFNAESKLRDTKYVLSKISHSLHDIINNETILTIGNIHTKRDWIHASDVAKASHYILQESIPQDYVIGSGISHSIKEFIDLSFSKFNINVKWDQDGVNTKGYDSSNGRLLITTDSKLYRPYENINNDLVADNSKLYSTGFKPEYNWDDLVNDMINI